MGARDEVPRLSYMSVTVLYMTVTVLYVAVTVLNMSVTVQCMAVTVFYGARCLAEDGGEELGARDEVPPVHHVQHLQGG